MTSPLHWYETVWNVNHSSDTQPKSSAHPESDSPLQWLEAAWTLGPTANLDDGRDEAPSAPSHPLRTLWSRLLNFLAMGPEPRIWQSSHGSGAVCKGSHAHQTLWNAYDPETGRSIHGVSETELRAWLEARYYQTRVSH